VTVTNAIIGDGSLIKAGTTISNSIIGLRSLIGENCDIQVCLWRVGGAASAIALALDHACM
jgi:ADP-glucose pyrophosphorylase